MIKVIILAKKGTVKEETDGKNIKKQVKFEKPHKVANEFIDIIAPTLGLSKGLKLTVKARLKLAEEDELRQCMLDVLKFLAAEYKK